MKFQENLFSRNSADTCKQMDRPKNRCDKANRHNSPNMPKKLVLCARELKLYQKWQKLYVLA
jgi:hypothetical protein